MMKVKNVFLVVSLIVVSSLHLQGKSFAADSKNDETGAFSEARPVESKDEFRVHLGLNVGLNSPHGDTDASPELGINMGYQPYIPFGLGAELSTSRLDDATQHQRTSLLIRGTYNFGGDIPLIKYSYLGAGAGPIFISDQVEWAVAPVAGFDIPLSAGETDNAFSLGLDFKYLFMTETPDSLVSNASLKYWF